MYSVSIFRKLGSLFANDVGADCISTKLEVKNDKITGKLKTKNCYGIEKLIELIKNTI